MTLIETLKNGVIPDFIKKIAQEEDVSLNDLTEKIINAEVVVPYNPIHSPKRAIAIGSGMDVKINVNVGTSLDRDDLALELEKIKLAERLEADAVMDLSVAGDLSSVRKTLISNCQMPFGTVPMYEIAIHSRQGRGNVRNLKVDDFFEVLERQAQEGVDFFTIHAGITLKSLEKIKEGKRILDVVSRGGALMLEWMVINERENPFYEYFDRVLEISYKYDVTISLGDALRPGSIFDAGDDLQYQETFILSELVKMARDANVGVMVEGPGHVPLHKIDYEIKAIKEIVGNVPLYVLGPLVIDTAAGYDHINAAIGATVAAWAGADFLCYVTGAEHLCLPDLDDVRSGIMAFKIAAQAVNISRGKKKHIKRERLMSEARAQRDWKKQIEYALDSEKAKEYRDKVPPGISDTCSMCSKYCSLKIVEEFLNKKVLK